LPFALRVPVLLDLVSNVGATARAGDRRDGLAGPATNLVTDDAAGYAANDGTKAGGLAFLFDLANRLHSAAVGAARLCERCRLSAERNNGGENGNGK
jgi:hypothetical protein